MSESPTAGFGKYVPGFDFLQSLAKGAGPGLPPMASLAQWVAPSLNAEELEKRIGELKAVHFWLEQNSRALGATIQALEVQKLTLATLKGMNFHIGDMANAFKFTAPDAAVAEPESSGRAAAAGRDAAAPANEAEEEEPAPAPEKPAGRRAAAAKAASPAAGAVDPLQLWGALTQQFQNIAATALQDVARSTAMESGKSPAGSVATRAPRAPGKAAAASRGGKASAAPRSRKRASS